MGTRLDPFDGALLRAAREAKGWPQARLARHIDKAPGTIYAWENNQRSPGANALKAVADALGINPSELLDLSRDEYRLAHFRVVKGYQQRDVATKLKIPLALVGELENAYYEPPPELLTRLADLYDATEDEIRAAWARDRAHLESGES